VEKEISKVTKEIGQILAKFGVSLSGYFILYANTPLQGQINDIDSDLNTAKATDTGRLNSLKARIQRVCILGFINIARFLMKRLGHLPFDYREPSRYRFKDRDPERKYVLYSVED
jgi:hypothetical protein